jgi:hypothetical protein
MQFEKVLTELKRRSDKSRVRQLSKKGVGGEIIGVSISELKELKNKIEANLVLANQLWETEIHEARMLATMIVEPGNMNSDEIDRWLADIDNEILLDNFITILLYPNLPLGIKIEKISKWVNSNDLWIKLAGWKLLIEIAIDDHKLDDDFFITYTQQIDREIERNKPQIVSAMKSALVAIGSRNTNLKKVCLEISKSKRTLPA